MVSLLFLKYLNHKNAYAQNQVKNAELKVIIFFYGGKNDQRYAIRKVHNFLMLS